MEKYEIEVYHDKYEGVWSWRLPWGHVYGGWRLDSKTKASALRSARAFAARFKVPPKVVVEGEE